MKRAFRKTIFWVHLVIGLAAGAVIAVVAFTGAVMAFEPQILEWAERDLRRVTPADSPRLSIDTLLERVRERHPEAQPFSITLSSDPSLATIVSLGRTGSLYLNPYTGEPQSGRADQLREFFTVMLRLHRWLTVSSPVRSESPSTSSEATGTSWREIGGSLVGIATIIFLTLAFSGLYLWWPRNWTLRALKSTSLFNFKLKGKARDWNWHNVIGLWSAPALILICLTGIVMAYRPVSNWIYQRPQGQTPGGLPPGVEPIKPAPGARPLNREALFAVAMKIFPQWKTLSLRTGQTRQRGGNPSSGNENRPPAGPPAPQAASFSIRERGSRAPVAAQLLLDPYTGAVLHRESFADYGFRRALRAMNLSLHNGTAGGIVGQIVAFLACVGGLFLVYTGFALSWRRFFGRRRPLPSPITATRVISTPETRPACPSPSDKVKPATVKPTVTR